MSVFAPYLFSGSVSLYLSYKFYNSYYNQPFQYLEIEEELNKTDLIQEKNDLIQENNDLIQDKEIIKKHTISNDCNKKETVNGKKMEIIEILETDKENNDEENKDEENKKTEQVYESEDEEVFGFGSLLDKDDNKDLETNNIKKISNKIIDNIIEKALNDKINVEDKINLEDKINVEDKIITINVTNVNDIVEEKNELSINEEILKLQENDNKLKEILKEENKNEVYFRPKKPRRKRKPKKKYN